MARYRGDARLLSTLARQLAAAIARTTQLARAALGDAAFDHLHAEGRELTGDRIAALAFGTGDSV